MSRRRSGKGGRVGKRGFLWGKRGGGGVVVIWGWGGNLGGGGYRVGDFIYEY